MKIVYSVKREKLPRLPSLALRCNPQKKKSLLPAGPSNRGTNFPYQQKNKIVVVIPPISRSARHSDITRCCHDLAYI